jgi:guanine nucleotide-binding protein G(i) subunit alpha
MDQIQAKTHDKKIAKDLDIDARNNKKVHKLLLLGAGESGKSTLFKQMNNIYGKKFPPEVRAKYVQTIHNNVIDSCRVLALHVDKFGQGCDSQEGQESKARFENITESVLTQELATSAKQLWFDPGIQRTYRARNKFQLHDSTQYFLEKVDQVFF